jgi:hypothetical protein
MFAAALRVVIEVGTWLSLVLRPEKAIGLRKTLEFLARSIYFVGIPMGLLIRFLLG